MKSHEFKIALESLLRIILQVVTFNLEADIGSTQAKRILKEFEIGKDRGVKVGEISLTDFPTRNPLPESDNIFAIPVKSLSRAGTTASSNFCS